MDEEVYNNYLLAFVAQRLALKNYRKEIKNSRETHIGGIYC